MTIDRLFRLFANASEMKSNFEFDWWCIHFAFGFFNFEFLSSEDA